MDFILAIAAATGYFAVAFALGWIIVMAYDIVTPSFKLWPEIQKGNLAVALAVGGQIIGAGIVFWSAISHNAVRDWAVFWTLIWAAFGGAMQIFGFLVFELITPRLAVGKELAEDNRAVGFVSMSIAVALGVIVSACIS